MRTLRQGARALGKQVVVIEMDEDSMGALSVWGVYQEEGQIVSNLMPQDMGRLIHLADVLVHSEGYRRAWVRQQMGEEAMVVGDEEEEDEQSIS